MGAGHETNLSFSENPGKFHPLVDNSCPFHIPASRLEAEFGRHIAVKFSVHDFDDLKERLVSNGAKLIDPKERLHSNDSFLRIPTDTFLRWSNFETNAVQRSCGLVVAIPAVANPIWKDSNRSPQICPRRISIALMPANPLLPPRVVFRHTSHLPPLSQVSCSAGGLCHGGHEPGWLHRRGRHWRIH